MKKITPFILLFLTVALFSSCGSLFKKKGPFTVESAKKSSTIYVEDQKIASDDQFDPEEYFGALQTKLVTKGYKDEFDIIMQERMSIFSLLTNLFFMGYFEVNPYEYDKYYQLSHSQEAETRQDNQRFISVKKVDIKVDSDDLNTHTMTYNKYKKDMRDGELKEYDNFRWFKGLEKDWKVKNARFSSILNGELRKLGYIDTTGSFLSSKYNSLEIEAELSKVYMYFVTLDKSEAFTQTVVTVNWIVKDGIDETLLELPAKGTSGKFLYNNFRYTGYGSNQDLKTITQNMQADNATLEEALANSIEDAINSAINNLLSNKKLQELLDQEFEKEEIAATTIPSITAKVSDLEEAVVASVTVKTPEGHGSGFFISNDGYVLTNYHVIADAKSIEIMKDGKLAKAEVVKVAKLADLAILKADFSSDFAFEIPSERTAKVGMDIYAIGTPSSVDLPSTLSKGIISGFRKANGDQTLIQTDVSINFGNSGGPLVKKNGQLIGIVNSKLAGFGIEGISFGLTGEEIMRELNITYEK